MDQLDDQSTQAALLRGADPRMLAANQKANRLNLLSAVLQMANNPAAAAAAKLANQNDQQQYAPVKLGTQGFALPSTGEFVASPIYQDEKEAERQARLDQIDAQQKSREQMNQERLDQKREHDQSQGVLLRALAEINGGTRRDVANIMAASRNRADPEEKAQKDLENRVTKFSGTLEKSGVPEFESALQTLENTLNKYPTGKIPGVGKLQSMLPNAVLSPEAQQVRSNMQGAANTLLKARSGTAVSGDEQRRFLTEVGSGAFMDEATLRNGWANVRKSFDAKKDNLIAGVPDEVLSTYNERSAVPIVRQKAAKAAASSAPPQGVTAAEWAAMKPEEKALWQK